MENRDYCVSCDGYEADVGKPNEHGWCERCSYRNTLITIAEADPVDMVLDPTWAQRNAEVVLLEWQRVIGP